jgi:hypothetical protein
MLPHRVSLALFNCSTITVVACSTFPCLEQNLLLISAAMKRVGWSVT